MAAKQAAAPAGLTLEIPATEMIEMSITLVGESELIVHKWSKKALDEILHGAGPEAKKARPKQVPIIDALDSLIWLSPEREDGTPATDFAQEVKDAVFGFPCISLKNCAVDTCSHVSGVTKVQARGAFHVLGEHIPILGGPPYMRRDMVRVGIGTAASRFRGAFRDWKLTFSVILNKNLLTPQQLISLYDSAGFGMGLGEWRPQHNGPYGRFHVERSKS